MEHGKAARVWVVFAVVSDDIGGHTADDQKGAQSSGTDHSGICGEDGRYNGIPVEGL
jgi:hypothetical protein